MKKAALILFLIACCINSTFGQNYELVWSDEFNADTIDTRNWNFEIGNGTGGWGNNELEYYTKRPENVCIKDSVLVITALKENYNGFGYTSARLQTRNKAFWKYGRIEMRAKLPKGRGIWPAFWLMPQYQTYGTNYWPDNGEIDIMEYVGYNPNVVYGTVHTNKNNGSNGVSSSITYYGVENNFHLFAIEWTPTDITFYVDSYKYGIYQRLDRDWQYWPFDKEFYIVLNMAVGGNWGGAEGIDDSIFPQTFQIDYIRVYQLADENISHEDPGENYYSVSPNPCSDFLKLSILNPVVQNPKVSVFNLGGVMVIPPLVCTNAVTEFDFSLMKAGIYIMHLENKAMTKNIKVIKN